MASRTPTAAPYDPAGPETWAPLPPPITPRRTRPRWPAVRRGAIVVALIAAAGVAIAGFVREEALLLASAWTFALIPLGYWVIGALRGESDSRAARLTGSSVLVALLAIPTFLVLTSCTARLGPDADLAGATSLGWSSARSTSPARTSTMPRWLTPTSLARTSASRSRSRSRTPSAEPGN